MGAPLVARQFIAPLFTSSTAVTAVTHAAASGPFLSLLQRDDVVGVYRLPALNTFLPTTGHGGLIVKM